MQPEVSAERQVHWAAARLWTMCVGIWAPLDCSSTLMSALAWSRARPLRAVAMHFLNFEARHLFGSISQLQLGIVDRFFDLPPDDAGKLLTPMEVSLKQADELAKFMRFCQQVTHTQSNAADLKVRCLAV